ncbi:MAG: PAS domain S-box protein [Methanoregula sp.]|jgi:PAS domain S-box-containing protein
MNPGEIIRNGYDDAALQESELRYRRLFETAQDALLILEGDTGVILDANKFIIDMLGYPLDYFVGTHLWELGFIKDKSLAENAFLKLKSEGYIRYEDLPLETKDGRSMNVEFFSNVYLVGTRRIIQCNIRDITGRKHTYDALQLLANIVEFSDDAILGKNFEGIIVSWNTGAEIMYGYRASEVIGKPVSILIPAGQKDELPEILKKIQNGDVIRHFETKRVTKAGKILDVSLTISPIKNPQGTITGASTIARDVTESMQAQRLLKESEIRYRNLFEVTNAVMVVVNPDTGKIVDVNSAACRYYGYSREEFSRIVITDINTADPKTTFKNMAHAVTAAGEVFSFKHRKKNGEIRDVEVFSTPIIRDGQRLLHSIVQDVTERKRAEELLNQQVLFLQQLTEAIPNPVFYKDTNGVYLGCNRAFEGYIGLPRDQIIGKSVYQVAPKELADKYDASDKELFAHPGTLMYESQVKYADGSIHYVIFNKATFSDLQGNPRGIVGIIHDITGRKRAEEQLRQNRQLLASAMDLAQIVSWEYDVATSLFTFDDRFFAFHGTTAEREGGYQMSAETYVREFVYPKDIPRITEAIKTSLTSTDPTSGMQVEHRIVRRDGTVRTIMVRLAPVFGAEGKVIKTYGANQDITGRKKAEEELRESEARYRNLFTNMLEGFAYCRMLYDDAGQPSDFVYLNVNSAFDRIIGTTSVTGKRATEVFPGIKAAFPELLENYGRVAMTGEPASFDLDFKPSGKWLHISVYSPAKDHFVVVFEDITARRIADENLKKAEEKYRNIFETALDGIYQISPKGLLLTANPAMARILGYDSVDDLITTVTDTARQLWVHQEERKNYLRQLRENNTVQDFECGFYRKDKSQIWVSLTTHTVRGTEGKILVSEGILVDITRRKNDERNLIDRESEYRTILRTTMDGFSVTSQNGEFLDTNDAFCRLTGYSREELLTLNFADIQANKTAEESEQQIREIIGKGEERFETQYRRKDSSVIDVEVSVVVSDRHGGQFITFHHDITERKRILVDLENARNELEQKVLARTGELKEINESLRAEIELRTEAQNKIVSSLREKEMLLKEIHHRVKNNMQVISSLLFMQARAQNDEKVKAILKESQDRIKAIALVHEKLYQSTDLDRIDYTDYLQKITGHLFESYKVDQTVITLHLNSEKAVLHIDKAVPCSLIINEMISNSLKHAFPGGRKGVITIDFRKGTENYILTYSDDGIGIPEGITFDRTESLGMQLINGLTKQINGSIKLDRTAGTKYTITFPAEGEEDL